MTREFLGNFKVGEASLPKEAIDAIMAENGRDINAEKAKYADYESVKNQLNTAQEGLKKFEGIKPEDAAGYKSQLEKLQADLKAEQDKHAAELDEINFQNIVKDALQRAKARNVNAVLGALGAEKVKELKDSKDRSKDIDAAVKEAQKEYSYLFDTASTTPPPYAAGTGTGASGTNPTFADSLRSAMGIKKRA